MISQGELAFLFFHLATVNVFLWQPIFLIKNIALFGKRGKVQGVGFEPTNLYRIGS